MKRIAMALVALLALVTLASSAMVAESPRNAVASGEDRAMLVGTDDLTWKVGFDYGGVWLTIRGPEGWSDEATFGANAPLCWTPSASPKLDDGVYRYDLRFAPLLSAATQEALDAAPERPEREVVVAELIAAGEMPESMPVIEGTFLVLDGSLQLEIPPSGGNTDQGDQAATPSSDRYLADHVISDDLIVDSGGSICVGQECADGEAFGDELFKIKQDWTQILFHDTSSIVGFPTNDWRLKANDRDRLGADYFALVDETHGTVPLRVDADARTNALRVSSNGYVGIGKGNPSQMLHLLGGNTPTIRLEQDNTQLWGYYTWDLMANESFMAIRDSVAGTQPFRVYPGQGNEALVLSRGRVGMGTARPDYDLHLYDASDYPQLVVDHSGRIRAMLAVSETQTLVGSLTHHPVTLMAGYDPSTGETGAAVSLDTRGTLTVTVGTTSTMQLDTNGNMVLSGALTEASDVNRKEHFQAVDGETVLAALVDLPISSWNYIGDDPSVRHMGPMAQDFYAAFGLGENESHLAPLDVNGVTLAAIQAQHRHIADLEGENADLAADVERLEQSNADLEARVAQLEALVQASLAD